MNQDLALAQAMRFAEELRELYSAERAQRRVAEEALARVEESYRFTVRALAKALELRDDATGGHAERVTALGLRLARVVAPNLAGDPQLEFGFLLHDVGKIGVPDAVLLKPGSLDARELEVMRFHTVLGERIAVEVPYLEGVARDVIASHHEHWDGGGYPRGLAGEQIPRAARIFAVVDAYDAMTNDRPYRASLGADAALQEIAAAAGTQFEPAVAGALAELVRREAAA